MIAHSQIRMGWIALAGALLSTGISSSASAGPPFPPDRILPTVQQDCNSCDWTDAAPEGRLGIDGRARVWAKLRCPISMPVHGVEKKVIGGVDNIPGACHNTLESWTRATFLFPPKHQSSASPSVGDLSLGATDSLAGFESISAGGACAVPLLVVMGVVSLTGLGVPLRRGVRGRCGDRRRGKAVVDAARFPCAHGNGVHGRGGLQTSTPRVTGIARAQGGMERTMDRDLRHHLPPLSGMPDSTTGHRPLVTGHCSRRFQLALALLLTLLVPCAFATPYEVIYDANTPGVFPEDLGWQRFTTQGGVQRTIGNGNFSLMAENPSPNGGSDHYIWDAMETLNPDPGETFFAEWRMRLLPGSNDADVGVFIATDGMQRAFNLAYAVNVVHSSRDDRSLFLDTTVFRTYRLESLDMIDYVFYIDGELAWEGFFDFPTTRTSQVRFGDFLEASASSSEWDYFQFGVRAVPEPGSAFMPIAGAFASVRRRKTRSLTPRKEDQRCLESQHFW